MDTPQGLICANGVFNLTLPVSENKSDHASVKIAKRLKEQLIVKFYKMPYSGFNFM